MTLPEELRSKSALTSFRARSTSMALLAINEALEAAAEIADQEGSACGCVPHPQLEMVR